MTKDPPRFSNPKSTAWRLVPDQTVKYSEKAAAAGREAQALLHRVIEEHPTTPWALLAQRELKDPLGFKWVETRVQPIVRNNNDGGEAKKKAMMNQPKPEAPPKL